MATEAAVELQPMIIDGHALQSLAGRHFLVLNPFDNSPIARVPEAGAEDVELAVQAARRAFESGPWPRMAPADRARLLLRIADILESRAEALAELQSRDTGKPLRESTADVRAAIDVFRFCAGAARQIFGATIPVGPAHFDYTRREPVGVCALLLPFNFPIVHFSMKVGPALAAGNTVVLKPSSDTPLLPLAAGQVCQEAGLPPGVVNLVTGPGSTIGPALVGHPAVNKISFTGETATGRGIMRIAAESIKRVTLELGGKSANIVFADADLAKAARGSMPTIFGNAGQRCTARSRLLVQRAAHDRFLDLFLDEVRQIRLGNPLDALTDMGPIVSRQQRDKIVGYVGIAQEEGARVVCGGSIPEAPELSAGNFFAPTVLDGVRNDMRVAREEIFGPVLSVITFDDEDEAVRLANDTIYGLAGAIWTQNLARGHRVAHAVRTGNIGINTPLVYFTETPFGGFKQSGLGRELGLHVLEAYTEIKNVVVSLEN